MPYDCHRPVAQARLQPLVVKRLKEARGTVAAPHREHDVGQASLWIGEAVEVGGTLAVGTAKSLVATLRDGKLFHAMTFRPESLGSAMHRLRIKRIAGRSDEVNRSEER